jgi:hypothetical protein
MMRRIAATLLTAGIGVAASQAADVFQPFEQRAYRLVNGVAFDGNEHTLLFALLHREVLAHRGRPDTAAPETGIYTSQRAPNGSWTEPALAPFSGAFADSTLSDRMLTAGFPHATTCLSWSEGQGRGARHNRCHW